MLSTTLQQETIVDEHKQAITIQFSICEENEAQIFYMQPLNESRVEVEHEHLDGFMKKTLIQILVKFHHYDPELFKKKKKEELIHIICSLHGIAITPSADKLNMSQRVKNAIAAKQNPQSIGNI
eukprot:527996_1